MHSSLVRKGILNRDPYTQRNTRKGTNTHKQFVLCTKTYRLLTLDWAASQLKMTVCWSHQSKYRYFLCDKLEHFLKTHQWTRLNPHLVAIQVTLATSVQCCAFQWCSRSVSQIIHYPTLCLQAVYWGSSNKTAQDHFSLCFEELEIWRIWHRSMFNFK